MLVFASTCIDTYIRMYLYTYISMHPYTYIRMYLYTYNVCIYIHTYVCMGGLGRIIYMHTQTYTYV